MKGEYNREEVRNNSDEFSLKLTRKAYKMFVVILKKLNGVLMNCRVNSKYLNRRIDTC